VPRPRSFDDDEIVARAADLFTVHGYGGTSIGMLVDATGLGRQSLYNAFGDKTALYLEALDRAVARFATVATRMAAAPTGREALDRFFDHLLAHCASGDPTLQRCIVSGGLLEGIDEPAVALALESKWRATHELLRGHVERGQRDGSIPNPSPSGTLADLLMGTMSGLRVTARTDASRERLAAVLALTLQLLDRP
jgi:TetR/AcrR family transcriptional repressor of nem operon